MAARVTTILSAQPTWLCLVLAQAEKCCAVGDKVLMGASIPATHPPIANVTH